MDREVFPPDFICAQLGLSKECQTVSMDYYQQVKSLPCVFGGKKPSALNSGLAFIAAFSCDEPVQFTAIESITGVRAPSIKNSTMFICKALDIKIPVSLMVISRAGTKYFSIHKGVKYERY